jgi:maltooligosyltrehalose trehalohydrolase
MPFGAELADGATRFRLWAPAARRVDLSLESTDRLLRPMTAVGDGWFELKTDDVGAGARYSYRIDEKLTVPDPASRFNPDDVHRASEVVDPCDYAWRDSAWHGRPWEEAVVYELHVGTMTPRGSFLALIERLDELKDLGVTALELMPLADFPGRRNWGYDGVLWFAPDASYGTPQDLKRLVDAAHERGLMMLLDVVYNHFGPEGNYLHAYAPQFFNERHKTPWGAAINFDGEESRVVRDFVIHNALYWLEEFHFDGLRVDAVHAIADDSMPHIVAELAASVRAQLGGRHVHLILENELNQARWLERDVRGATVIANAQWNDDIHHAAHVLVTGEQDGYYADYAERPLEQFGRCLAEGFAYQGDASGYREGERRGEMSAHLPATAFVNFLQNHDQVGNRAFGERLMGLAATPLALKAATACILLAPSVPMLFMGEEFRASTPFQFFCDFGAELAAAVTRGRREEFKRFERFQDPATQASIPDPNAEATFQASKLKWDERERSPHAEWLAFCRDCLHERASEVMPRLPACAGKYRIDKDTLLRVEWTLGDGSELHLIANFGDSVIEQVTARGAIIHAHGCHADAGGERLEPGAVVVWRELA